MQVPVKRPKSAFLRTFHKLMRQRIKVPVIQPPLASPAPDPPDDDSPPVWVVTLITGLVVTTTVLVTLGLLVRVDRREAQ